MVCWIANNTHLFRANCFPTDQVISNWNRCSHRHWPNYLLHWNMDQAKDDQESTFYTTMPPLINVKLLSLFLASEKVKVLNHPLYSLDLSPCGFFLFPRLMKMLSGNKYMSRSSLGSAIYQCLQQIPKEDYLSAFRDWVKMLQTCFSKGAILWRFVIKICLIKRRTEVIRTQWQNFLQDPRIHDSMEKKENCQFFLFCKKRFSFVELCILT